MGADRRHSREPADDLIYGRNAVLQALRAGSDVRRVLIARGTKRDGMLGEALEIAQRDDIPIVEVERDALDRMVKRGSLHQGIVAEAQEFQYVDVRDILSAARESGEPPFLLLLDNIQYVTNFGALLRTAEIIGVHGVIIPEHRQASVTGQVRKASAGAVDFMNVAQVTNLSRTIEELKKENIWIVGVEEAPKAIPYNKGDYTIPIAFVVGSEVDGLRRLTRDKCDYMVQLPMWGKTPSLNVSVAGSIVLYEARMQRLAKGIQPR